MRCKRRHTEGSGARISVSPLSIITAAALVALGHGMTLLSYAAVLIPHELAHAYVGERLGYAARSMRIMPYGISLGGEYTYIKPSDEVKIAIAGPAINLAAFFLLAALWWLFPVIYSATEMIAYASLFTAAVNMLPVFPMDGGRVMRGLLRMKLDESRARFTQRVIGVAFGAAAACAAFAAMLVGLNFTFATLGLFLLASLLLPESGAEYGRLYAMTDLRLRMHGGLPVREIMVSGDTTLAELFGMLRPDRYTRFTVCDNGGAPMITLDERQLEQLVTQFNCSDAVISVAKIGII